MGFGPLGIAFAVGMGISGVVLLICGLTVVREYDLSKDFIPVKCKVTDIEDKGILPCDYCVSTQTYSYVEEEYVTDTRCDISFFPCVAVNVQYQDPSSSESVTGLIHSSAIELHDSHFPQCSYSTCDELISRNSYHVETFKKPYVNYFNSKEEFQCFHQSSDPHNLIIEINYTGSDAFHSMFWPGLVFVLCAVGLLVDCICLQ